MKLHYYPETDPLYIDLKSHVTAVDSQEVADGVVIDLESEGRLVGIDIDRAAGQFDLSTLETKDLPQPAA
ncbi:DUF2283 domain-containing protein [bacterium]|nr:DUF2283 domain-containing protein [bacterium]